ncbi:MAG TPA: ABC transporter ATP-binding protein [Gemmatimonadaceae bacterium]|nr:ABC transporter ATP-binding protein [Gemmatimonadaceae bacterium]
MISVQDLTKLYGEVLAVDGLSFDVGAGEILGLVGPNGAGKTTTLRALAGILRPTRGRILIAGTDLAADPVQAKRALAFVPDEPQLFDDLTVIEHLRFTARLYGVTDVEQLAPAMLDEMELTPKRDVLTPELSRGMKQKLAIACALLHRPRVLILDEPLTGLDPAGMRRMKNTIVARARDGAAVILSSHLLDLVEELCTSLLVIQRGREVASGPLERIVAERPQLAGQGLEAIFLALTDEPPVPR